MVEIDQKLSAREVTQEGLFSFINRELVPVVEKIRLALRDISADSAPDDAGYITVAADASLPNERVLTAGANITIVDSGAGGPLTISASTNAVGEIVLHDTSFSPVGLWQFNQSLSDSSGNAFTLSVDAGSATYGVMDQRLYGIRLGSCRLKRAYNALLHQVGNMTIGMFLMFEQQPTGEPIVTFTAGVDDTSSTYNYNYQIALSPTGTTSVITDRVPTWFSEHGVGVNDFYTVTGLNLPPPGEVFHLMVTRTANVIQFYVNGTAFGPASSALTATDGGSVSELFVGGVGGVGIANVLTGTMLASLVIIPSALTAAQVKAEYNRTLGPYKGDAP